MKQLLILAIAFTISMAVCAQTVKRLENQKDAWGLTYTFTGEVKNGKPNGMGIAKYTSGNVLRYAGNFVNGMYNGKGTMLFTDGAFLTGNWVNGKLSGKGANLTSGGTLYIGDFVNGEKILEYKNPKLDSAHALGKTLIIGGNTIVKDGYISLQSNSHPMDFRKVEIMEY